jgi:hypothetical protein
LLSLTAGIPWLCAAPVRSLAHINSVMHYRLRAPGQPPVVHGVNEQRVTALCIHIGILLVCARARAHSPL